MNHTVRRSSNPQTTATFREPAFLLGTGVNKGKRGAGGLDPPLALAVPEALRYSSYRLCTRQPYAASPTRQPLFSLSEGLLYLANDPSCLPAVLCP
jgi:hypothetical protein